MKQSRFTDEQIIGFRKQADAGMSVKELCRSGGFSQSTFNKWRSRFGGMEPSDAAKLRELEADRAGADYGNCLGLAPQGCMLGVQRVGVLPPSS
jgi:putative transposase